MNEAIILTRTNHRGSRKVISHFQEKQMPYREYTISKKDKSGLPSRAFLKEVLHHATQAEDLITRDSKREIEEYTLSHLLDWMMEDPYNRLKFPMIKQGHRVAIGFGDEEEHTFLPEEERKQLRERLRMSC